MAVSQGSKPGRLQTILTGVGRRKGEEVLSGKTMSFGFRHLELEAMRRYPKTIQNVLRGTGNTGLLLGTCQGKRWAERKWVCFLRDSEGHCRTNLPQLWFLWALSFMGFYCGTQTCLAGRKISVEHLH